MIKLFRLLSVQLTFFLSMGILVASSIDIAPRILIVALLLSSLCLLMVGLRAHQSYRRTHVFALLFAPTIILVGMTSLSLRKVANQPAHYSSAVTKQPHTALVSITRVLRPTAKLSRYEARLYRLDSLPLKGKVLLMLRKDSLQKPLQVDSRVLVGGVFREINPPANPHGFDYKSYLLNRQIHHQLYASTVRVLPGRDHSLRGWAAGFRERVQQALSKQGFTEDTLSLIHALILGQRQSMRDGLVDHFVRAGAIHLLAVSGLHVGILLLFLTFLCTPLRYVRGGRLIVPVLIVSLLWGYALLAGLSPSVVRAVSMFSVLAVGRHMGRFTNTYNTLFVSMFLLLLADPYYLFDLGFQLSYLAVFSIVWWQPRLAALWQPRYWLSARAWQLLTVSLAAQIGVAPLGIYHFHQFPGLFLLTNLLILPLLGWILITGFLVAGLALFDYLPFWLTIVYRSCLEALHALVAWIAAQDAFVFEGIPMSLGKLLLSYLLIISIFCWTEKRRPYRLAALYLTVFMWYGWLFFEKYHLQTHSALWVFQQRGASVIGLRYGERLRVYSTQDSIDKAGYLSDYLTGTGIRDTVMLGKLPPVFSYGNKKILVVDRRGLYQFSQINASIILLQNAPRINLERLLRWHRPRWIIADGSNYPQDIVRWAQTCAQYQVDFYSTREKGAFVLP